MRNRRDDIRVILIIIIIIIIVLWCLAPIAGSLAVNNHNYNNIMGDSPPAMESMFINSSDTLRHREIPQGMAYVEWNDRPPLFRRHRPERRRPFWRGALQQPRDDQPSIDGKQHVKEEEDENPNLLKGVSYQGPLGKILLPSPLGQLSD